MGANGRGNRLPRRLKQLVENALRQYPDVEYIDIQSFGLKLHITGKTYREYEQPKLDELIEVLKANGYIRSQTGNIMGKIGNKQIYRYMNPAPKPCYKLRTFFGMFEKRIEQWLKKF